MSDIKERLRAFDSFAVNPKICKEAADHIATLEQESAANLQRALVAEKDYQNIFSQYLELADAMHYKSGKDGLEWSAEEWADHLYKVYLDSIGPNTSTSEKT